MGKLGGYSPFQNILALSLEGGSYFSENFFIYSTLLTVF